MDKLSILTRLQEIYSKNENMIKYLKQLENKQDNSLEDIMISYDLQAGSYVENYKKNSAFINSFIGKIGDFIIQKNIRGGGVLEAGVGEATTLVPLLKKIKGSFDNIYGFDISWSRIKVAQKFMLESCFENANLFVGDLFSIPLLDNSMDLVYTSHAIEPNGGKEREILKELYRVAKKYLILLEPAYELASEEARKRMKEHGYVTNLYQSAIELGYEIEEYSLYGINANPLNPTGFLVIKKKAENEEKNGVLCCPWTKTELELIEGAYYSQKSLLAYPIIAEVPCLTKQHAIVATKFLEKNK